MVFSFKSVLSATRKQEWVYFREGNKDSGMAESGRVPHGPEALSWTLRERTGSHRQRWQKTPEQRWPGKKVQPVFPDHTPFTTGPPQDTIGQD